MLGDRVLELTATRERRAAAELSVAVVRMRAHGVTKALDGLPVRPLSHERNLGARGAAPSSPQAATRDPPGAQRNVRIEDHQVRGIDQLTGERPLRRTAGRTRLPPGDSRPG